MEYQFWKYQGTGNDFIFFDGRKDMSAIKGNKALIEKLCDRRFGIGADGLIILEEDTKTDFRMVYYNSDGGESTMCGNGGRCSIAFAKKMGFSGDETVFEAIDGKHSGSINGDFWVELGMIDVSKIERISENTFVMNTGSPHYIYFVQKNDEIDIVEFGKSIRYSNTYKEEGINVNVVKILKNGIQVETYERGVEDETYSCGTGVTACAIAFNEYMPNEERDTVRIVTKGGELTVKFKKEKDDYQNITLCGPAIKVFEGKIKIDEVF